MIVQALSKKEILGKKFEYWAKKIEKKTKKAKKEKIIPDLTTMTNAALGLKMWSSDYLWCATEVSNKAKAFPKQMFKPFVHQTLENHNFWPS